MQISFGDSEHERLVMSISDTMLRQLKQSTNSSVTVHAEIHVGGFTGQTDLWLDVSDFLRLAPPLQQLYKSLAGEARFETIENQIAFVIKGDSKGHMRLSGHLLDRCGDGNKLQFHIAFDQTLLRHSLKELEHFLCAVEKPKAV